MNKFLTKAAAPLLLVLVAGAASAAKGPYCGNLENAYGPFDYRLPNPEAKHLVESAHFTESVENGVAGNTGRLTDDLDYTLRAFPNHPRALTTVLRLATRPNKPDVDPSSGWKRPPECYFERAVRFQPDDGTAWALYAQYMYFKGQTDKAVTMMEKAAELEPDDPAVNYNLGLIYAKQKKFVAALPHAQKAYAAGFPLPALKQMLVSAGKWVEPPPPEAKPAEAEAEPAAPATASAPEAAKEEPPKPEAVK
ncbi:tetratricopeptide repeat protein [Pseudoduganella sp. RAF53_2]|jgi:tetratricopeptide (TPR) repeat protein|uniref:tetratricopeptide repeat protein n=1 Tax=unclassified Pseudoduganella TaxID=2637179 RepID=UPI003F9A51FA